MVKQTKADTAAKAWKNLYAPYSAGFYTPEEPRKIKDNVVTIHELVVDLGELYNFLQKNAPHWKSLNIYTDVLIFPFVADFVNFEFKLGNTENQTIQIFARTIQLVDGKAAFLSSSSTTRLTIYTNEFSNGKIYFSGFNNDPTVTCPLALDESSVGLTLLSSKPKVTQLASIPSSMLHVESPAYWMLESEVNIGTALMRKSPEVASSILSWVGRTSGYSADSALQHLAMSASNLQGIIQQFNRKIPFVPPLQEEIYGHLTKDYIGSATLFESEFNHKLDQLASFNSVASYVKTMDSYFKDQTGVAKQLLDQSKSDLESAENILTKNNKTLLQHTDDGGPLKTAQKAFNAAVDAKKKSIEEKAIIDALGAIVQVGTSIGEMAVGDEAGVVGAVEGIAETASTIKQLISAIKKIAKVIKKIANLILKIKKAQEAIEKAIDGPNVPNLAGGLQISPSDSKELFDNTYWDTFEVKFEAALAAYVPSGTLPISGAEEYLAQLKILAIYGKAVYGSQVSVAQLSQKVFQASLNAKLDAAQAKRLKALEQINQSKINALEQAKIIFYRQLLSVKQIVIFYMEKEIAALQYWSGDPKVANSVSLSLASPVALLSQDLTTLESHRVLTLNKVNPQVMNLPITLDACQLTDSLQSNGLGLFTLKTNDALLRTLARVRISEYFVYLNDEAITDNKLPISINVRTSGAYIDNTKEGQELEYVANDCAMRFEYENDDKENPILRCTTAKSLEFSYFQPTPFTTWGIEILKTSPVDLSKVSSITFRIKGSAEASTD